MMRHRAHSHADVRVAVMKPHGRSSILCMQAMLGVIDHGEVGAGPPAALRQGEAHRVSPGGTDLRLPGAHGAAANPGRLMARWVDVSGGSGTVPMAPWLRG